MSVVNITSRKQASNVIPFPQRKTKEASAKLQRKTDNKFLDLNEYIRRSDSVAYVRVEGNGFEHFDIFDGDLLVVDFSCVPKIGDIVYCVEESIVKDFRPQLLCQYAKVTFIVRKADGRAA